MRSTPRPLLLGLLGPLALGGGLLFGCSAPAAGPGDGGSPDLASPADGGGGGKELVGGFRVSLVAPVANTPGYTTIVGRVADGPSPSIIVLEQAAAEGLCRLLTPRVPFCKTPCGGSAACVENDRCQPYPTSKSVGAVKVKGLKTQAGASEFSMMPVSNNYQPSAEVKCPYPAFAEGATIRVETEGGAYPPFAIEAKGIAPLVILSKTLRLESGKPLALSWTPAGQAGISTLHVKLDISHHGGSKGQIECEAPDSGTLEISAALIKKLLELGVAGFPSIILTRRAGGSTTIAPGRVELSVAEAAERFVEIPGVVSCVDDSECPMGKKCQPDLTCK